MTILSTGPCLHDLLDQQLITLLREDGRVSISKLSELLKVLRGTVQNPIDRLVSSGAIFGFTVRAHEAMESGAVKAIMMIEVVGRSTSQVIKTL